MIVSGKCIEAKKTKAKTVPITAPLLLKLPITLPGVIVNLCDASPRMSERAKRFSSSRRTASDVRVLGLMKKGWNSLCSSL